MTSPAIVTAQQFSALLAQRRSTRDFEDTSIRLEQALAILTAGQGITGSEGQRAAPSAHRLYPLLLRLLARNVQGLEPALYDYFPENNELKRAGELPAEGVLLDASLASDFWLEDAPCVVVICANIKKAIEHFVEQDIEGQQRGQRYVDFEAGAASQNMHLQSMMEDLGAIVVMGVNEQALKVSLQLADDVEVVAALCVGHIPAHPLG
ncbi:nitroreductase family protein [Paenalcaligenes niemegkensis]|uniref:nitroreductase family protein n=1 Tax=Paenalcaligenes niemegkensis TaxID=2895469 RepID=UPI001EE8D5F0|nr:nitroreductase family protein [Paenalcaligenes niemegkensis]MCQ9616030.1 nitroreductase family protein [Paenalcaligenes niemegkensis]